MKDVYQLADLSSREILDTGADKPARLAVIGYPVSHSASPAMHQAALDAQGKDIRLHSARNPARAGGRGAQANEAARFYRLQCYCAAQVRGDGLL